MKFGVNTFIWTASFDRSHLPLLPAIKEHGFDGIEVSLFRPADFAAADIRRGLRENALECTICSVLTGGLSVISEDASVRRETLAHMAAHWRFRRSNRPAHSTAGGFGIRQRQRKRAVAAERLIRRNHRLH